jgi:hypothetical protein
LFLLLPGDVLSEDPIALSRWADSPPKLDGQAGEWGLDSLLHQEKIDLDYGFKNDDRNLYILLVFRNPKSLSAIDSVGMTISGGPEGTKNPNTAVKFVKRILTTDQYISALEDQGVQLTAGEKEGLRNWPQHFVFAAYAIDKKGNIIPAAAPAADVEPPAFRTRRSQNISTYEFRIPLASREAYPAGIEAEPGKTISVSFEWGGSAQKALSPRTSWSTPWSLVSGGAIGDNDETRAQEFLNSFDSMSRPSLETKKFSFRVDVRLAKR